MREAKEEELNAIISLESLRTEADHKKWNGIIRQYILTQVILAFWLVLTCDPLEDKCTIDVIITKITKFFPLLC